MAERRMFSRTVIGSARFLRMPSTSRLLYYDLGMQADDDGVVEAFSVMRTTGATEDDLRVLASKGFVTVLDEDLVTYITDWSRNNYIQKDRYHPSIYHEMLVRMTSGAVDVQNLNKGDTVLDTGCIHDVSKTDTQARAGEERRGESMADKPPKRSRRFVPPSVEEVREYCRERKNSIDSQRFVDYYSATGWTLGRGKPIKDWRACVRTWEARDRESRAAEDPPPKSARFTIEEFEGGERQ